MKCIQTFLLITTVMISSSIYAQTWENEMLLDKVKSYSEKHVCHYNDVRSYPFEAERSNYDRYKKFDSHGRIIKYKGSSSWSNINKNISPLFCKERIEGRVKYWQWQGGFNLFNDTKFNLTKPLYCLNIEPNYMKFEEWELSYDKSGNIDTIYVNAPRYDFNHKLWYICKYDNNGNLTSRTVSDPQYESPLPLLKNKWDGQRLLSFNIYDQNGREDVGASPIFNVDLTWFDSNTYVFGMYGRGSRFKFNSQNKLIESGKSPSNNITHKYRYDINGCICEEIDIETDNSKTFTTKHVYTYDKYNNIENCHYSQTTKNTSNNYISKSTELDYKWVYTYDNHNNWITRTLYMIKSGEIEIKTKLSTTTRTLEYYN